MSNRFPDRCARVLMRCLSLLGRMLLFLAQIVAWETFFAFLGRMLAAAVFGLIAILWDS